MRSVAVQAIPSRADLPGHQSHAEFSQAELPVAPLTESGLSGSTGIATASSYGTAER